MSVHSIASSSDRPIELPVGLIVIERHRKIILRGFSRS